MIMIQDWLRATISFCPPGAAPLQLTARPVQPVSLLVGTGYGLEYDWKHGMYQIRCGGTAIRPHRPLVVGAAR
jgi:hypothetical protein